MLEKLGWNTRLEALKNRKNKELLAGRVSTQNRDLFKVITDEGEWLCNLPGTYYYEATFDFPAVGDWILLAPQEGEHRGVIQNVLKRTSVFKRKAAGNETKVQVIAANIDIAFLVMSCNKDFNVKRLERYLIATWDSGAKPIILLTKADLIDDNKRIDLEIKVSEIAIGVPYYFVSNNTGENLSKVQGALSPNLSGVLLGSSGVGKSTLVNTLLGLEKMTVNGIREDDSKGKHTTTHRELIILPKGGVIIDTPGMREFQLWSEEGNQGFSENFQDVQELISQCKFNDCQHDSEPGCAVKEALSNGGLSQERYEQYLKLQKELAYIERKENENLRRLEKEKWKKLTMQTRRKY